MGVTSDRNDPRIRYGIDEEPVEQSEMYIVMSDEELARGFVRPVRQSYIHNTCGTRTIMGLALSETYAANPKFYGATFCVHCSKHRPVDEFKWTDGSIVGS